MAFCYPLFEYPNTCVFFFLVYLILIPTNCHWLN